MRYLTAAFTALLVLSGCKAETQSINGSEISVNSSKAEALIKQLINATGGDALDVPSGFHETGEMLRSGFEGRYETWGDLHSLRSLGTITIDGAIYTQGFDGKTSWTMGPDGIVKINTLPNGVQSARLSAYLSNGGYLYPDRHPATYTYEGDKVADGVTYDVVTVMPDGIAPIHLWLDKQTHLLQRISGMDGDVLYFGKVDSYKEVDGVQVVFGLTQNLGPEIIQLKLDSHSYEPVDPAMFSPPVE